MTKVVSFINYKGGVGKTTTAYHFSCSLAQHHGQRVLMIDIDPQTNLTFLCITEDRSQRNRKPSGSSRPTAGLSATRMGWMPTVTAWPVSGTPNPWSRPVERLKMHGTGAASPLPPC